MGENQASTRHCPTCGSVDLLIVASDPIEVRCLECGRLHETTMLDPDGREHTWEDPEWSKAGEQ